MCAESDTASIIEICSSDTSIELIQQVSNEKDLSIDSLEDWLSGSETISDSSYQPSEDPLSSCLDLSLNSKSTSESPDSTPTADAPELFESEVPPVVNLAVCQNLDLGSLSDSFSLDSDLDSFTCDCNPDGSKTNLQILTEKRAELDTEWNQFVFSFKQRFLNSKHFTVHSKHYKEGTQK